MKVTNIKKQTKNKKISSNKSFKKIAYSNNKQTQLITHNILHTTYKKNQLGCDNTQNKLGLGWAKLSPSGGLKLEES